jgi:hypothetical protein
MNEGDLGAGHDQDRSGRALLGLATSDSNNTDNGHLYLLEALAFSSRTATALKRELATLFSPLIKYE